MGEVSVVELAVRLVLSLGVVLALMAVAAKVLHKGKGFGAVRRAPVAIDVVARQSLGKNVSVAVVHTAGRELVLGVTQQTVTLLTDREAPEEPAAPVTDIMTTPGTAIVSGGDTALPAWKTVVETMRDRTARRS